MNRGQKYTTARSRDELANSLSGETLWNSRESSQCPTTDLSEAIRYYSSEQTCIDLLASIRWLDGQVICTACGEIGNVLWLANQKRWKCRGCKKQFSVKVGTIMEDSLIGLDKWMVAFWMLANCRNGVWRMRSNAQSV